MKKRPLFGMSFSILIILVVISIVPPALFNIRSFKEFFYQESEAYLRESCILLKNLLPPEIASSDIEAIQSFFDNAAESTALRITVTLDNGEVVSDTHGSVGEMDNHATRPEIASAMVRSYGSSVRKSATVDYEMMYSAVRVMFSDNEAGTIRLARSLADINSRINLISRSTLLSGFILLIIAAWISAIIAGRVSMLLQKIKITTKYYASGNFSQRLYVSKPGEIAELTEDLNSMGEQLKERISTVENQKNELQLILDNMTEPVLFTDKDLRVIRINKAAERLFKIREFQHKGKSILEVFMNSQFHDFAEELLTSGVPGVQEITLDRPRTIYLEIHGTAVFDNFGKEITALLLVMHDVTRAKNIEQMRKDFVSNVSHELKTPVTMIKGYIETLLYNQEKDIEKYKHFLQIMEKHSTRIEAIISDLLLLSGIEKNEIDKLTLEEISALDLITSAVTSCAHRAEEKNISISIECDENFEVTIFPLLAEQALINLVDNAIKYSDAESQINIEARVMEDGKACFSIKDQGCGISEDQQDRIFERFYRVDKARSSESGGTGLGLSIVKHIALCHNGTIEVKSSPGAGSEFILCL